MQVRTAFRYLREASLFLSSTSLATSLATQYHTPVTYRLLSRSLTVAAISPVNVTNYSSLVKIPGENVNSTKDQETQIKQEEAQREGTTKNQTDDTNFNTGSGVNNDQNEADLVAREQLSRSVLQKQQLGNYSMGKVLGHGRFGVIKEAQLNHSDEKLAQPEGTESKYAIKVMNKRLNPKVCNNEEQIYRYLKQKEAEPSEVNDYYGSYQKYLSQPIDIFVHEQQRVPSSSKIPKQIKALRNTSKLKESTSASLCIVFELFPCGDLFELIVNTGGAGLTEDDTKRIAWGILKSMDILHFNNVVHRDIKPENILFRADPVKPKQICLDEPVLTDFGLSHVLGTADLVDSPAGTFGYASPEILSAGVKKSTSFYNLLWSKDASGMYNSDSQSIEMHDLKKKTDMWSLGVLIYACIAGELPFPATLDGETTVDEHLERALAGPQFDSILWADVSDQCKDVIQKLLHYSPEFRPSVTQIMQHIWFSR